MRLSTDDDRDDRRAAEVISAAIDSGITVFDTAHAYGRDGTELGHNERLLAGVIKRHGAEPTAQIVTKGGMTRAGGAWVPDGRARAIRADCEASLTALGGLPVDLFLIHAPDPRTPWRTSVRALARLAAEGLVRRVGVSNVNLGQLEEARELAPIAAVEVAVSIFDDRALRGGILERCADLGIPVIAHSPLGGPRRARELAQPPGGPRRTRELTQPPGGPRRTRQLAHSGPLAEIAAAHGVAPAEVAIAWLLALSPTLVAIPGARRPETVRSSAHAGRLTLAGAERVRLDRAFGHGRRRAGRRPGRDGEVVVVMGIPGAGKSRVAAEYVAAGHLRLNRDERGGGLRALADALDRELGAGARRVVLDNTYLTRASRSHVVDAAARHGLPARCVWLDTPLAQAQVNLVERLLHQFGTLPAPDELRRLGRRQPGVMAPTSQMRALRELETPTVDEGFARVDVLPFARAARSEPGRAGVFVAAAAAGRHGWETAVRAADPRAPHLVFDWHPAGAEDALRTGAAHIAAVIPGPVESALCPHQGGPPACWCRPPLPGLLLAWARAHDLDPARCALIGCRPTDRTLATTLGARYLDVS